MIFTWWATHQRLLPWRETRDPYRIMISEIMLQQTQVSRALPKYEEFLARFPTVFALAQASTADVLRIWKGMGYNRRALYLKKAAEAIVSTHTGKVPDDEKTLSTLPGIGPYTAAAIAVFAFEKETIVIDTNIRQILLRLFFDDHPQPPAIIADVARQLLPAGKSWQWHQALMDYGALALPRTPKKKSAPAIPFHQSNRFFRGRILDLLREKPYGQKEILQELHTTYQRPEAFFSDLINKLQDEELVTQTKNNLLQLPE